MPKAKPPKNLVVDGTAKLAAKSKPSDKHEAPDLNIEEATVASPRPSRKRTGGFFDFDDGADAEPLDKTAGAKSAKPKKATKMVPADEEGKSDEVEAKPATTAKKANKGKAAKKEVAGPPSETRTKPGEKEKRPRKSKATKDDLAEVKPESSKKSKKSTKGLVADTNLKPDATPKTAKAESKTKAKRSAAKKVTTGQKSAAVAPGVAMDEEPLKTLLEPGKEPVPDAAEQPSINGPQVTKARKNAKKPAKESNPSTSESAKASVAETAANGANIIKEGAKSGTENVKKAAKSMAPATETAADVADAVKASVKAGTKKAEKAVKTPAGVVDESLKKAKAGAEKLKKGAKPKDTKMVQKDDSVKLPEITEEQIPGTSRSRKRKALASADAETVKSELLDPLSEHASANKKQRKTNTKSKSIGDTVGEILATATEGANAARASLGGLATSIMGGVSEATEETTGAEKTAEASAENAKGKGKATAKDLVELSGKTASNEETGTAEPERESSDEPDAHTTALLAGFDSDSDEETVLGSGFQQGQELPPLPQAETTAKKLENVKRVPSDGPDVVYVGRIPHGFYEHEMREYFSQFGDISRLRLSRSRKSGASKHYAFIEFASSGVANIVADTMNNYLMFGHILKCKVVPKEQIHETLWKGANKRFKAVPWNRIEGRKLEMGLGREQWTERIEGEKKRRASKNEKTKEIGYEFETGELKGVNQVPVRDASKKIENEEKVEEEKSLVTGAEDGSGAVVVVSEEVKTKKVKKARGKTEETITKKTKRALDVGEEPIGSAAKKVKKGKAAAA